MLKLGVHVSSSGNIYKSFERAAKLKCNSMQIFSRNPRQHRKDLLEEEEVVLFREARRKYKIDPVVIHIPYTLNLASNKPSFYKITISEFITDLKEADRLGADFLVTHMGSYKGSTEKAGLSRVGNALVKILKETKEVKCKILLENISGSGNWLGANFSQIKEVFDTINWNERVGLCLDTAHAWAAGYKIDEPAGVSSLVTEIDKKIGLDRLGVVHLNDTKEEFGSLRDRHFAIGQGKIGKIGFKALLNHPKLANVAFILETPKETEEDDLINLRTVRSLYRKTKK